MTEEEGSFYFFVIKIIQLNLPICLQMLFLANIKLACTGNVHILHESFLGWTSSPTLWKFQLSCEIFAFKPLPSLTLLGIANGLPWGGYCFIFQNCVQVALRLFIMTTYSERYICLTFPTKRNVLLNEMPAVDSTQGI